MLILDLKRVGPHRIDTSPQDTGDLARIYPAREEAHYEDKKEFAAEHPEEPYDLPYAWQAHGMGVVLWPGDPAKLLRSPKDPDHPFRLIVRKGYSPAASIHWIIHPGRQLVFVGKDKTPTIVPTGMDEVLLQEFGDLPIVVCVIPREYGDSQ